MYYVCRVKQVYLEELTEKNFNKYCKTCQLQGLPAVILAKYEYTTSLRTLSRYTEYKPPKLTEKKE